MFCSNCGAENEDGSKFCDQCGSKLAVPEPVYNERNKKAKINPNQLIVLGIVGLVLVGGMFAFNQNVFTNSSDSDAEEDSASAVAESRVEQAAVEVERREEQQRDLEERNRQNREDALAEVEARAAAEEEARAQLEAERVERARELEERNERARDDALSLAAERERLRDEREKEKADAIAAELAGVVVAENDECNENQFKWRVAGQWRCFTTPTLFLNQPADSAVVGQSFTVNGHMSPAVVPTTYTVCIFLSDSNGNNVDANNNCLKSQILKMDGTFSFIVKEEMIDENSGFFLGIGRTSKSLNDNVNWFSSNTVKRISQ